MARKIIEFDPETLRALDLLASDSMKDLQELADEAFRDLLKKHKRPASLKEALRESTRQYPANDHAAVRGKRKP
jgi:predicted transcriptional regulator